MARTLASPAKSLPRGYRGTFSADASSISRRRAVLADASLTDITALAGSLRNACLADAGLPVPRVEAFALACRAAGLTLGLEPFEVQVLAGLALSYGALAEVRTGEGKTLIATLPAACFALAGRQVHVMTANQYLARRDAEWMRPVYETLGLTVGFVDDHPSRSRRRTAYGCNIVYGTANQFGFDYLQDHLITHASLRCQSRREVALLDEADALLLDDARTPLIISGAPSGSEDLQRCTDFVASLPEEAVDVDLSEKVAMLNDTGFDLAEVFFDRADLTGDVRLMADLYAALRARFCYRRDKEYLVAGDSVLIIDESTGRTQSDRRWQHGLHEAIEAKEGVTVHRSAPTLGSITVPSLLALYGHIGAMTGTAVSDKEEFNDVYGLHVLEVPTNKPSIRVDAEDELYPTSSAKFTALVAEVSQRHDLGQPVLIGAPTVADAEAVSARLTGSGIAHVVLSAKDPAREAEIIAQAGRLGAVTVATNMAGRGVDILLGGDPHRLAVAMGISVDDCSTKLSSERERVLALGGLAVLATARHSSRRIDDQLRGRAGRQGEPGFSKFYLSLDDELLSIYANDLTRQMVSHMSAADRPVSGRIVSRLVATAQGKVEAVHRENRRSTNEFAAPIALQQSTLYAWRDELLDLDPKEAVLSFLRPAWRISRGTVFGSDPDSLRSLAAFGHDSPPDWVSDTALGLLSALPDPVAASNLSEMCLDAFLTRNQDIPEDLVGMLRTVALSKLDAGWHEHLYLLEAAKSASQLRSSGQLRPTVEFIRESGELFKSYTEQAFVGFAQLVSMGKITLKDVHPTPAAPLDPSPVLP